MPKLETRQLAWFKEEPQARQNYDEAELLLLGHSLKDRQLQPVLARPDGTIVAGHRRFRAAKLVGLESLQVIIVDGDLTPAQIRAIQLTENIHRSDLTGYEKFVACKELLELNPEWQGKDLAAHLHLDPASVTRLNSPSKCIPEAVEALKSGKITISDTYAMSKLDPADQPGLLALKLSGASRDTLERQGRKTRTAGTPATRASKLVICLVSGVKVTITGGDLSLDEAIDAVKDAQREMVKGRDQGLDVRTLAAVTRDKAKAGS